MAVRKVAPWGMNSVVCLVEMKVVWMAVLSVGRLDAKVVADWAVMKAAKLAATKAAKRGTLVAVMMVVLRDGSWVVAMADERAAS